MKILIYTHGRTGSSNLLATLCDLYQIEGIPEPFNKNLYENVKEVVQEKNFNFVQKWSPYQNGKNEYVGFETKIKPEGMKQAQDLALNIETIILKLI